MPAKLPPARLSASQEALRQIKSSETLATIETLLRNVAVDQSQENTKRRVRLTNKSIEKLIVNEKGGLEAMKAFGWISDPDDSDFIIVPKGTQISMSQVILISLRLIYMITMKEDVQNVALGKGHGFAVGELEGVIANFQVAFQDISRLLFNRH